MPFNEAKGGARLPALDGLRAVSICLVLLGHLSATRGFPNLTFERWFGDYANLGVMVFFVISGFLITRLLVEEHTRTGRISIPLFYARRILRLFPAFLLFLACLMAANAIGWIQLQHGDITAALTYTVNFRSSSSWYIGHLWSLSVEEQFYLVWPAVLVLCGLVRARWAAASMILLSPAARLIAVHQHLPGSIFPCVADSLACGCLLALCGDAMWKRRWYRSLLTWRWVVPTLLVAVALCNRSRVYAVGIAAGVTAMNVLLAVLIHYCVSVRSIFTKILSSPPLVGAGILSYSLYLWQQVFLNRTSNAVVSSFPLNLLLAIVVAYGSYSCVERPLNGLRGRLRSRSLKQPATTDKALPEVSSFEELPASLESRV
jgi:peptidoglycan/LPS O-acetylase OafA/YrhL